MHESFLHYIWQLQYFDKKGLTTSDGEVVQVLHPGILNTNAGPDFSNARLKIGQLAWAGTVEIHTKASDWNAHLHQNDKAYDNVVLHVVWQDDRQVVRADGTPMPTIELRGRVNENLVLQYRKLVNSGLPVPCSKSFSSVPEIVKLSMLDKALLQRLEKKSSSIIELWKQNNNDWEETVYQLMARNFGFKVNSDPFFQLARGLPCKVLVKHANRPLQVEALLFGQAGFLEKSLKEDYYTDLQREYRLLATKYKLRDTQLKPSQWRFLRLRPANFPTLRLAQFTALMVSQKNLFSKILESDYRAVCALLQVEQSEYWKAHYKFGTKAKSEVWHLGQSGIDNIIINTVVPVLAAYGKQYDDQSLLERAVKILQEVSAEKNRILSAWGDLGLKVKNAFDSQALIELYNSYCSPRQCLSCTIGTSLLKPRL